MAKKKKDEVMIEIDIEEFRRKTKPLSLASLGIFMDLMCNYHLAGGKLPPLAADAFAKRCRCTGVEFATAMEECKKAGLVDLSSKDGVFVIHGGDWCLRKD